VSDTQEIFSTCCMCVVMKWCKLRSGEVKLPSDYMASFCVGHEKVTKAVELAGVPREYKNANLFHYVTDTENVAFSGVIMELLANPVEFVKSGTNLALINKGKGTGKTWTAVAVMNEFLYKVCRDPMWFDYENPVALYIKFGAWANKQRDIYLRNEEEFTFQAHRELRQMKEVPLLVLDDVGSGRITPIIRDLVYDVIDYRKEEHKSTIYTSNFPYGLLRTDDKLGDVVVSRMLFNTMVIPLGGRDRREDNIYKY
jgi:DNA replication protein DnaC